MVTFVLCLLLLNGCMTDGDKNALKGVTNPAPDDGAVYRSGVVQLTWAPPKANADKCKYDLYMGLENPPPLVAGDLKQTRYKSGQLKDLQTYYWKVVVKELDKPPVESPVWTFKTDYCANVPHPDRITGPLTGMEFVRIPSGSFEMGCKDGKPVENPPHTVTLSCFFLMTTEVTQKMWQEVMGDNPSHFKGDKLPVESVSWEDCQRFIDKLNEMDSTRFYRLPSEAEWEYSCRAGGNHCFDAGSTVADLERVGWFKGNSGGKTQPVASKKPNNWGLYDMHGNVGEWCEDWFCSDYGKTPPDGSAFAVVKGKTRVLRGGGWASEPIHARSVNRSSYFPDYSHQSTGFRLACCGKGN